MTAPAGGREDRRPLLNRSMLEVDNALFEKVSPKV